MDAIKPDFDFPNKVRLYERAELIRIDELVDNFGWVCKLSAQLRAAGQGLAKSLQKALLKARSPAHPDAVPFECEPYAQGLDAFATAVGTLGTHLASETAALGQSFQERVVKPLRTVGGCMARLEKERQAIALKKRQHDDLDFEVLNMRLGSSGTKLAKAITQTTARMQKLKRAWEVDEAAHGEHLAVQHASLEKIDWTAMALIAEATGCMGNYVAKLSAELSSLSVILDQCAKSDRSKEIMEKFSAYVASLPDPMVPGDSTLESPRSPEGSHPATAVSSPQANTEKHDTPKGQSDVGDNQSSIEVAPEQPVENPPLVDQEA